MLVLGLGGAAISITKGDLSLVISGMSLASIVGILLNIFLPKENETGVATLVEKEVKTSKTDMLKLKKDIKDELTVELKEDILEAIKDEMSTYKKKGKK